MTAKLISQLQNCPAQSKPGRLWAARAAICSRKGVEILNPLGLETVTVQSANTASQVGFLVERASLTRCVISPRTPPPMQASQACSRCRHHHHLRMITKTSSSWLPSSTRRPSSLSAMTNSRVLLMALLELTTTRAVRTSIHGPPTLPHSNRASSRS